MGTSAWPCSVSDSRACPSRRQTKRGDAGKGELLGDNGLPKVPTYIAYLALPYLRYLYSYKYILM
jgi:hypothetical protein